MDFTPLIKYLNNLVARVHFKTLLSNRKGAPVNPATEEGQAKLEAAMKAAQTSADEIAKSMAAIFQGVSMMKGEQGDKPTDDELLGLIKPLIPAPVKGDDGKTPTKSELVGLIKPLIPAPIPGDAGHTPTNDELLRLIQPLIPVAIHGHTPTEEELAAIIRPLIPVVVDGQMPQHEWDKSKTRFRFETAPGEWGEWSHPLPTDNLYKSGGGASYLSKLRDVYIPRPTDGQVLTYDSTTQRWVAETVASGSVSDDAYGVGWNGDTTTAPSKNAVYDKIETLAAGGITRTVVVTSGSATMGSTAATDYAYFVAGAHTMSLPTAVGNTNRYTVKNNHSVNITIDTAGAENIEGAASISIAPQASVDIQSDGTNWYVI